jgi:hypothetical protein
VEHKLCAECGASFPLAFFPSNCRRGGVTRVLHRPRCKRCEQERRDRAKQDNRFRQKARAALRTHAQKFVEQGLITKREELTEQYGWSVDRLEHDMRHAYANGCPYCRQQFSEMAGGLEKLTVDIVDPAKPPFYETNTRLCCVTCNKEKQQAPPEGFGLTLQCHRQWEKHQENLKANPWFGLPLFGSLGEEPSP